MEYEYEMNVLHATRGVPPIHGWGGIFHEWGPYPCISAHTRLVEENPRLG